LKQIAVRNESEPALWQIRAELDIKNNIGKIIKPAVGNIAELHQVLDVVHAREVYVDEIGKSGHRVRQASVGEQLEQVAHTVATIERHPRSAKRRGSTPSVAWRVKSIPLWRSSSMWSASATSVPRPSEVELPGAGAASVVRLNHRLCCLLVGEGETNLDELEYIDIGLRVVA